MTRAENLVIALDIRFKEMRSMLNRYRKKFNSVYMESFKDELNKAIQSLSSILKSKGISFSVIGGAARNKYGYEKITDDIDIVVSKSDKSKLKDISIGYMRDISSGRLKVFTLHEPKAKVEVIFSDEISGDGIHGLKYEEPNKISKNINGIPYITLKNLIMYKLSSGMYGNRYKDFDDIQQLILINKLKRDYADSFREDLREKYVQLFDEIKNIKSL